MIFEKKKTRRKLLRTINIFIFSTNFVRNFFSLKKSSASAIINVHRYLCKVPVIMSDFNKTLIFSIYFRKIFNCQFFFLICQVGAEFACRRTGGQTDMTKLIVAFRNSAKGPKILCG
jgi:hypothetical protein